MHIIFVDVDYTVYPISHEIHPQLFKDIFLAQKNNVEIVLCTGNAFLDNLKNLAKKLNVTYVVASNGASIFNAKTNELLYSSFLSAKDCNEFLDFARKNKIMSSWWNEESVYYNEFCSKKLVDKLRHVTTKEGNLSLKNEVGKDPLKIEFIGSKQEVDLMTNFLSKYKVNIVRIRENRIEISKGNISKGFGVDWICSLLKVEHKNTGAVGDSPNDIPMFEKVDLSYAVDNATSSVKKVATNYVSSVEQNGLGEALIDYMYRKKIAK